MDQKEIGSLASWEIWHYGWLIACEQFLKKERVNEIFLHEVITGLDGLFIFQKIFFFEDYDCFFFFTFGAFMERPCQFFKVSAYQYF